MRQRSETIGGLGRAPARHSQPIPPINQPPAAPPPPERGAVARWLHGAFFENTGLKFLSMVLAITVFLLVNTDKDREITVRVGLKYDLPAGDKILVSKHIDEVTVAIKGPLRRLRGFDEREVNRITVDLRDGRNGDYSITPDMVTGLPPGLKVTSVYPRSVPVQFDESVEKTIEIQPNVIGHPQKGYIVADTKVDPPTLKVRGPAQMLSALSSIRTEPISVENRMQSVDELVQPAQLDLITFDKTQRINVQVRIVEALVSLKSPPKVVVLRGDGIDTAKWQVTPPQVEVTLTGTQLVVEDLLAKVTPTIKLSAKDVAARDAPVVVEGVPPGIGVKVSQDIVKVTPVKAERP